MLQLLKQTRICSAKVNQGYTKDTGSAKGSDTAWLDVHKGSTAVSFRIHTRYGDILNVTSVIVGNKQCILTKMVL